MAAMAVIALCALTFTIATMATMEAGPQPAQPALWFIKFGGNNCVGFAATGDGSPDDGTTWPGPGTTDGACGAIGNHCGGHGEIGATGTPGWAGPGVGGGPLEGVTAGTTLGTPGAGTIGALG
jgi:hypothetical protein